MEGALGAELTHHLGYEKHQGPGGGNARNGSSAKTLKGDFGEVEIAIPRDRNGSFAPQIVAKHQRRFSGFDDKILSMYARGMSTREIQGHLAEIYQGGRNRRPKGRRGQTEATNSRFRNSFMTRQIHL